jgi:hypothetical protein
LSSEVNVKSIRVLEEQIAEHEMTIIKLKRARNSLLNVSTLPPEILGEIFCQNVILEDTFAGLEEGSHNFLLVCHHWFEVASCTPEIWSFWGNNLQDWAKRHLRYPTAPLDLVLNDGRSGGRSKGGTLDDSLQNSLQDRAARDTIRRLHLIAEDSDLLDSVLSPLGATCEEILSSSVESVVIFDESEDSAIDVSDFFANYRFPKLQRLELVNCTISSWDLVVSRTSALTILTLDFCYPSSSPTMSQLLSILGSNPTLREITLCEYVIPVYDVGKSLRVPLHHLKKLGLTGDSQQVFGLLRHLDHPRIMDNLTINLMECTVEDVSQIIGPYLRDHLRGRGKSHNGLGLYLSSDDDRIEFRVGDVGGIDFAAPGPAPMDEFVGVTIELDPMLPKDILEEVTVDLIAHAPPEEIFYFRAYGNAVATEVISVQFPSLRALHFKEVPLHVAFPKPTPGRDMEIFPSLRHLTLDQVVVGSRDWSPLTTFLARRASSGNRLDTLELIGYHPMQFGTEKSIRRVVREFRMTYGEEFSINE